ncbi:MAG: PAS domain S-box protein, partial [Halobacteriales archaeon]
MEDTSPSEPIGGKPRNPTVAVVGDLDHLQGVVPTLPGDILFEKLDANEAVDRVANGGVDCVVTVSYDSSIELLEAVREREPDVPFVVFSDDDRDELLDAGVTEHVALPVEDGRGVGRRLRFYAECRRSKRAERRLDSFMRHTPDQVWIHDGDGEVIDVNQRACESLGYDRDELRGMNIKDIEVGVEPDKLQDRWSSYGYGDTVVVEGRHRRKDGTEFPVEVNVGKVLMEGEERFLVIARDITRRETVEKSLRRLRKEHETVVENVQDPVFLIDVEDSGERFVFSRLNPAYEEQVDVSEAEARGRTTKEVFGDETGAELVDNYRRCVEKGDTLSYEETIQVPAGERTYHTKITPVYSGGGVTAVVG